MTFSSGQLIFAISFLVIFIIGISYAFFKDKKVRARHYKGVYWVFVLIASVLAFYYVLVKLLAK
jgi:ABC-type transport system involved in cytochrome c biogenesis permease component